MEALEAKTALVLEKTKEKKDESSRPFVLELLVRVYGHGRGRSSHLPKGTSFAREADYRKFFDEAWQSRPLRGGSKILL